MDPNGADVLRQFIIAVAGINIALIGLAILLYIRAVRSVPEHERTLPVSLVGMLVSKALLVFLVTQHVYAHLQSNSAKTWELWTGLAALLMGTTSLVMFTRRKEPTKWVARDADHG